MAWPTGTRAFTQLAADRQFAPLGLVLLAVLAQVEGAVRGLVPPDAVPGQTGEEAGTGNTEGGGARAPGTTESAAGGRPEGEDQAQVRKHGPGVSLQGTLDDSGVVVSREDVTASPGIGSGERRNKKKKEEVADESEETQPPLVDTFPSSRPKKSKKRKGDEFDDIFSSFGVGTGAEKSKKKKKPKMQEEFNDLFSVH